MSTDGKALILRRGPDLVPATQHELREIAGEVLAIFKLPSADVIAKPGLYVRTMTETLRRRGYAATVIREAMQRAVETEKWTPAIATIVQLCESVLSEAREKARQERAAIKAAREAKEAKIAGDQARADLKAVCEKKFGRAAIKKFDQAWRVIHALCGYADAIKWEQAVASGLPWAREAIDLMGSIAEPTQLVGGERFDLLMQWSELPNRESELHRARIEKKYGLAQQRSEILPNSLRRFGERYVNASAEVACRSLPTQRTSKRCGVGSTTRTAAT